MGPARNGSTAVVKTNAELARLGRGGSKYRNVKSVCSGGHKHDSKKEAKRCTELRWMQDGRQIRALTQQPEFKLEVSEHIGGEKTLICKYRADFSYYRPCRRGQEEFVVEDCKGMRTAIYRLKKKLMSALLHIEILET
jgi:hypothetical protein